MFVEHGLYFTKTTRRFAKVLPHDVDWQFEQFAQRLNVHFVDLQPATDREGQVNDLDTAFFRLGLRSGKVVRPLFR
jgi:hypothetical protein